MGIKLASGKLSAGSACRCLTAQLPKVGQKYQPICELWVTSYECDLPSWLRKSQTMDSRETPSDSVSKEKGSAGIIKGGEASRIRHPLRDERARASQLSRPPTPASSNQEMRKWYHCLRPLLESWLLWRTVVCFLPPGGEGGESYTMDPQLDFEKSYMS